MPRRFLENILVQTLGYLAFFLMEILNFRCFCFFLFIHLLVTTSKGEVEDSAISQPTLTERCGPIRKLFVFGDSLADTGNARKSVSFSWKVPYGLTFPGEPAGRFSDGRVLTDYIAQFIGTKSPVPYQLRKYASTRLHYGMNFAYSKTGVFDTIFLGPNMTTQIDLLEKLILDSFYTKADLQSSLLLVSYAGNDYDSYYIKGGKTQGLNLFIAEVVNQLALNLKRIEAMGASKIAVTALLPLGCLPRATEFSSFRECNATENTAVNFHNLLLQKAVAKLNNESNSSTPIVTILDLYTSFTTVIKNRGNQPGNLKFETPLKPCCVGLSSDSSCGSLDEKGAKLYSVCENPESALFWDRTHPSQAGWHAVYLSLKPTLYENF